MNLRDLPARGKERWQNFSQTQKIATILIAVAFVVSLFYLSTYFLQTKYAPLFSDLEVQEAGAITEKLKSQNVKYKITDQGKTIEVPEDQVYDLRMQLASEGSLPGNGQGFELFDQTKLAQTDFEQQVVYQRALQEELKRSIEAIDAVEQARVHLVLPEKSVFIEESGESSASVVIKLKPLAKLESAQVKGINDLLIGSVEGLKAENISIIDTNGNTLNDFLKTKSDPAMAANSLMEQQLQMREQYQQDLEKRLKQFLTPVYGPGKAVAMVSVELDFSKAQTTKKEIIPGEIVSEQKNSSSGTGGGGASGAAGTTSQMPGSDYPATTGGSGDYDSESTTTNYQHGEEVTVVDQPPGAIKRISTSVVVDSNVGAVDEQAIQQLVAAAIGYVPERGDEVTVQTMPLDTGNQVDLDENTEQPKKQNWPLYIGIGAAILILLAGISVYLIRRRRRKRALELAQQELTMPVEQFVNEPETNESALLKELENKKDPTQELKDVAKQNPEEMAQIIKLWLKE